MALASSALAPSAGHMTLRILGCFDLIFVIFVYFAFVYTLPLFTLALFTLPLFTLHLFIIITLHLYIHIQELYN